jgi:hypothetical protein
VFYPSPRFTSFLSLCLLGTCACAQDSFLPLPKAGLELPGTETARLETRFLKPTKSIKPPSLTTPQIAAVAQPQVNAPTIARLRRLILMPGGLTPEVMREQILAGGQSRQPVTVVGMNAPAPILAKLANLFGSDVNEVTQKKIVDTVRQGLDTGKTSTAPRRVEVVGWLPSEGVMAVAVYPES